MSNNFYAEMQHYKALSEVYQLAYQDQLKTSVAIMTLQGIYVELTSDLLQYKKKHGDNERVQKSFKRLQVFIEQVTVLSDLQNTNNGLKASLNKLHKEVYKLRNQVKDMKHQLHLQTVAVNQMPEVRI